MRGQGARAGLSSLLLEALPRTTFCCPASRVWLRSLPAYMTPTSSSAHALAARHQQAPLDSKLSVHMQRTPHKPQTPRKEPGCPRPKVQSQASVVVQLDTFCTRSRPTPPRLYQSSHVDLRCWGRAGGHFQHHRRIFSSRSERGGSSSSGAGSNEGKASHVAASSASTPAFTGNRGGLRP